MRCYETKPLSDFHRCKIVKDGRKSTCAACRNAETKKWRDENPAKAKACVDSWRERNAEAYAASKAKADREWRLANRDRIKQLRSVNAEERAENLLRWKNANRERVRDYERKRRALVRGSKVGDLDLAAVWDRGQGICALCDSGMDRSLAWPDPLSVSLDHIVPLAKQGPHTTENVQYAHLVCNMRKNDRILI